MADQPLTGQALIDQIRARRVAANQSPVSADALVIPPLQRATALYDVVAPDESNDIGGVTPMTDQPISRSANSPTPQPTPQPASQPVADVPSLDIRPTDAQLSSPQSIDSQPVQTSRFPHIEKPIPEETILSWQAPSRAYKPRSSQYLTTIAIIVLLLSLILFFIGQVLPIAVVIAVAFLAYVMARIPPDIIPISITTYGVRIDGNLFYWEELGRFWFDDTLEQRVLHIETFRFPFRLSLLISQVAETDVRSLLAEVLLEQKPALTGYERWANWLQERIPLEVRP